MENEKSFTPKETAGIFKTHKNTIYRWIKLDKIKYIVMPGGNYRIPESEIKRVLSGATNGRRRRDL